MQFTKHTAPEFDPYGNNTPNEPDDLWLAPTVTHPIDAVVTLPGSKSLTNRELILSALASGPSLLRSPLHSDDSRTMVNALRSLGTSITDVKGHSMFGDDWRIQPQELFGSTTIECGLAGTVMRFVPPLAALGLGPTVFDASSAARKRPMAPLINALKQLGVDIDDGGRKALPFTIHGTGTVTGGEVTLDASASSQFVSALLLVGSQFDNGLILHHHGEHLPSLPHIAMTIDVLAHRGVTVHTPDTGTWVVHPGPLTPRDITIEPDLSNAGPFLAAAVVTEGRVTIPHWPQKTTQTGANFVDLLQRFGARVTHSASRLTIEGTGKITGIDCDLAEGGELVPTIAALAALAETPSRITGVRHIRHHETDRLTALATEINNLGGSVTENDDGLIITPALLHGGVWQTYDDHRMATTGALIGLATPDVRIRNVETTSKTLPQFTELWHDMIHFS